MTLQLAATGTYSDGTMHDVSSTATWSSSKTTVATVSTAGLVSSVGIGTSTITAALGGLTARATMMVNAGPAVESIVYTFTPAPDGMQPRGSLVQDNEGNFYGVTGAGGNGRSCNANYYPVGCGAIYKITPYGIETILHSFGDSASDGAEPSGPLLQASDGNFYGVTTYVGSHDTPSLLATGTVFKLIP